MATDSKAELVTSFDVDEMTIGKFKFTPQGLVVSGKPDFDRCSDLGGGLALLDVSLPFVEGDFFNYVESNFNEQAAQIVDAERWSEETVRVYRWVASRIPYKNRVPALSFGHHQVVAALEPAEQSIWLQKALTGENDQRWTVAQLKKELHSFKKGKGETTTVYFVLIEAANAQDQALLVEQLATFNRTPFKTYQGTRIVKKEKSAE